MVKLNYALAEELGLEATRLESAVGAAVFAGNLVPEWADPLAMAYAGHQFGHFVPQLGDGRAILLGMGKVTPFTISVLVAGVANVLLSYIFVRYLHLGLPGIIYGTILAVVGRCAIWMPWYILCRAVKTSPGP